MRKITLSVVLMLLASLTISAQERIPQPPPPTQQGPLVTDEEFFHKILNLDYPGLEQVKKDVQANDYTQAKIDYLAHMRTRKTPVYYYDWHDFDNPKSRNPKYDTKAADKVVSNLLESCDVEYQYGDSIMWDINPTEPYYEEWTWQLSRHNFFYPLGAAYWATGDEKYAQTFVRLIRSWIRDCPLPNNKASEHYSRWRTIETGIRMLGPWADGLNHFLGSPSLDAETMTMIAKSVYEHGIHLEAFPSKNNWLTMEMNGLFRIGILYPEFNISKHWRDLACQTLYDQRKTQFYPDGVQVEETPGYHYASVENMLSIYDLAKINNYPLPDDYISGLEPLYNYYVNIMMPNGMVPAVNDSHFSGAQGRLATGFRLFPHRTDFQYLATGGKEGTVPTTGSVWLPWAGWYVMRSGWNPDDFYAHFEVGPFAPAHHHEDKLSILVSAYNRLLLTEGTNYAYDFSPWRTYVLSARAHNITRVDGKDQRRYARVKEHDIIYNSKPQTNRWISNEHFDFGEGWYTEGFGTFKATTHLFGPSSPLDSTVTQYRALLFVKNKYWIAVDVFTPKDNGTHHYDSWFHLNSEYHTMHDALQAVSSAEPNTPNLSIVPFKKDGMSVQVITGQTEPEVQGWTCGEEEYTKFPVATPTFSRTATGQWIEPYLLYPLKTGEELPVKRIKAKGNNFVIEYKDGTKDKFSFKATGNALSSLTFQLHGGKKIEVLQ